MRMMAGTALICLVLLTIVQDGSLATTHGTVTTKPTTTTAGDTRLTTYPTTDADPTTTTADPITTTVATTTTTSTTATTTAPPTMIVCQNGGFFDGIKCICTDMFYGPICEFASGDIVVGQTFEAAVSVTLRLINLEFLDKFTDPTSAEYKQFVTDFKEELKSVYSSIPEYKDVKILTLRPGSVIVDHDILVEMKYSHNLHEEYDIIFQKVEKKLINVVVNNCTSGNIFCFDGHFAVTKVDPEENLKEVCNKLVPVDLENFYHLVITSGGLYCVSDCSPMSPRYLHCNVGTCQLSTTMGPQCFCPRTDLYIYTSSRCRGKINKLGVFIGGPVAIFVLLIITLALGIVACRNRKPKNDSYYASID